MMASTLALQVALPLALLLWLALMPARNLLGLLLQVMGIGTFLLALALVAQWALPAWWLPRLYGALWLAIVAGLVFRRERPARGWLPSGIPGWAGLAISAGLVALGSWYSARALTAQVPPAPVVDIASPFGPGHYLVGHGGSDLLVNAHLKTLDSTEARYRPWRGQSYALDFFAIGPWGFRASSWQPPDPAEYAIFDARLHAPCAGLVVSADSQKPDHTVPQQDLVDRLGNYVILRCNNGTADIVLAHMRQGSLAVQPGEVVQTGDYLGQVGNSGASTEPHLHIHAQRPAPEGQPLISGEPLALRIEGRFLIRNDHLLATE